MQGFTNRLKFTDRMWDKREFNDGKVRRGFLMPEGASSDCHAYFVTPGFLVL